VTQPTLATLPPPPPDRRGWPWTEASRPPAAARRDGRPWPAICVVTPSYRQGRYLEETIRSVLLQGYPRLEYYVIDGGSTDESVEILRKYAPWLTGWVSEQDAGQSDAIAKGFNRASAECIAWLNSDDYFLPDALAAVGEAWSPGGNAVLAGDVINFSPDGRERVIRQAGITLDHMVRYWEGRYAWHQPGLFFPRQAYRASGGIDIALHYAMDLDLICRLLSHGCTVDYLGQPVARFRLHAVSKTCAQGAQMARETSQVSQRYWSQVDGIDRQAHDAYLFGELARFAAAAWLQGDADRVATIWRDARAVPGVPPLDRPAALLRYLALRLQRLRRFR